MIGSLRGTITHKESTELLLEVRDIGYVLQTPHPELVSVNETYFFYIYHAIRETASDLYGFLDQDDKTMFTQLLNIPKVGPKSALQIMSKASTTLIWDCVNAQDHKRLTKLSGIGGKTAEKIVQSLEGKVPEHKKYTTSETETVNNQSDIIDALVSMGYSEKEVFEVLTTLTDNHPEIQDDQSKIISKALKYLARI